MGTVTEWAGLLQKENAPGVFLLSVKKAVDVLIVHCAPPKALECTAH